MTRIVLLVLTLLTLAFPAASNASTPDVGGQWTRLPDMPANAVHLVAGPRDGKVLLIAGSGRNKQNFQSGTFTSYIWQPGSANAWRKIPTPSDMFCGGHVLLGKGPLSGQALVVGGTENYNPSKPNTFNAFSPPFGSPKVYTFDFNTERYTARPAMQVGRWYPGVIEIQDGRVVIVSGKDANGKTTAVNEIFNPATLQTTRLPGTRLFPTYPYMPLTATNKLFYSGTATGATGAPAPGLWSPLTNAYQPVGGLQNPANRRLGTACWIGDVRNQQLMVMGGGGTRLTDVINLNAPNPRYTPGPPLLAPKSYLNCSNLPDGSVLEAGGGTSNDVANASREVGLLRSPAGPWQSMNPLPAGEHRLYHSLQCVLSNNQVLSITSNPGEGADPRTQSKSMWVFSPPYMFKGAPPKIINAPTAVTYGGRYAIKTDVAAPNVTIRRTPSVTHSQDTNARLVSLPITGGTIQMPTNPAILPPGVYWMSAVNAKGVPSKAWPIHIQ